jgi:hypothetical protein
MKIANVYERKGVLFIRASSQTTTGVWIDDGPCFSSQLSASSEEVGRVVLTTLASSQTGIPHPKSWTHLNEPLLKASGVKTWSTFGKSARCVDVKQAEFIAVTPTKNGGKDGGGFVSVTSHVETLPSNSTAEDVGDAVKRAFAIAE